MKVHYSDREIIDGISKGGPKMERFLKYVYLENQNKIKAFIIKNDVGLKTKLYCSANINFFGSGKRTNNGIFDMFSNIIDCLKVTLR